LNHQNETTMKNTQVITDPTAIHLAKMLDQIEADFDIDPSQMSPEFLEDYVNAAGHMGRNFGRSTNRIDFVLEYLQTVY